MTEEELYRLKCSIGKSCNTIIIELVEMNYSSSKPILPEKPGFSQVLSKLLKKADKRHNKGDNSYFVLCKRILKAGIDEEKEDAVNCLRILSMARCQLGKELLCKALIQPGDSGSF